MKRFALLLIAALAACQSADDVAAPVAGRGPQLNVASDYAATDIGASMPGRASVTHAVNSSGVVLGIDRTNPNLYFMWSQSTGVTYPHTPSGAPFYPDAINDRGDIIGEAPLGGGLTMHWANGTWQEIAPPIASFEFVAGQAINAQGHFAGVYAGLDGNEAAFFWTAEAGYTQIMTGCDVIPFGMNDADQVVGTYRAICGGAQHVFSWTPAGGFRDLGTFGGTEAFGASVNNHGVIAATISYADNHAEGVLISPSLAVTHLPNTIGGVTTRASDINDRGEVVGTMQPATGAARPAYWDASQHASILSTPLNNGAAASISSNGIIAGQARATDNRNHAYVWMPPADVTPPVITYAGNAGTYTVDQAINITCTATDAGTGIASSTCANITGAASSFAVGENTFSATAVDYAGNSTTETVHFTVVVEPAGLSSLVNQWVANSGVANSLVTKLSNGSYAAFRNEIAAQSGKKIAADRAVTLLRLAAGL